MKVPDGEFMFPVVDRYNRVRDGPAHDAIERAVVESLTNQDAEQADEPAGNGEAWEEDFIADEDEWTNPRRRNKKFHYFAIETASPLASAFLLESDIPKRSHVPNLLITLKLSLFSCTGPINAAAKGDLVHGIPFGSEGTRGIFHPIRMTNVVSNTRVLQCMRPIHEQYQLLQVRSGALCNSTNGSFGYCIGLVDVGFVSAHVSSRIPSLLRKSPVRATRVNSEGLELVQHPQAGVLQMLGESY